MRSKPTPPVLKKCEYCGQEFFAKACLLKQGKARFCSASCRSAVVNVRFEHTCEQCGKLFTVPRVKEQRGANRWCSKPCQYAWYGTPEDRFKRLVDTSNTDGCWPWTGALDKDGYGQFQEKTRKRVRANRFAWQAASGSPVPPDMVVGHTCDTPVCVRNDEQGFYEVDGTTFPRFGHLFLTTNLYNRRDSKQKGRTAIGGKNGKHTHPELLPYGEAVHNAKFTEPEVQKARREFQEGVPIAHIARRLGLSETTVSHAIHRKTWKHVA